MKKLLGIIALVGIGVVAYKAYKISQEKKLNVKK